MNAELQGYTDSNGVSSTARPVSSQTSASAQNGETGSFEPSKRSGAAVRLNMDDVVMTSSSDASFPPGLEGAAVPPSGGSVALEGFPAQNLPELAPGDTNMDKNGDDAKIEVDVSEWTMDEWLTDHRGLEDPENIVDTATMTYVWARACAARCFSRRGGGTRGDFLGSRWDSSGGSTDGARASRRRS